MRIDVDRLDVSGTALVGDLGDRAHEWQMIRMGGDAEELARLEVDSDLDREACVARHPIVRRHGRDFTREGGAFCLNSRSMPW